LPCSNIIAAAAAAAAAPTEARFVSEDPSTFTSIKADYDRSRKTLTRTGGQLAGVGRLRHVFLTAFVVLAGVVSDKHIYKGGAGAFRHRCM
jgi:hypothetical protein